MWLAFPASSNKGIFRTIRQEIHCILFSHRNILAKFFHDRKNSVHLRTPPKTLTTITTPNYNTNKTMGNKRQGQHTELTIYKNSETVNTDSGVTTIYKIFKELTSTKTERNNNTPQNVSNHKHQWQEHSAELCGMHFHAYTTKHNWINHSKIILFLCSDLWASKRWQEHLLTYLHLTDKAL